MDRLNVISTSWFYCKQMYILYFYTFNYFRFTSLVENHLSEMCVCLRDLNLQVRANTLTLLIQLIQEDYLKLRCPLFFHILAMLNDEDQRIQDMTSLFIINSLLVKQKSVLVQHFVESLFHYNSYLVSIFSQYEK